MPADLADALRRLMAAGVPLTGASDHGAGEPLVSMIPMATRRALWVGLAAEEWPRDPDGGLKMGTRRLDLEQLLTEGAE